MLVFSTSARAVRTRCEPTPYNKAEVSADFKSISGLLKDRVEPAARPVGVREQTSRASGVRT